MAAFSACPIPTVADRHALGHLHDRQQCVQAAGNLARHRQPDNRQGGLRRDDARQVGREAGGADEDGHAALHGVRNVALQQVGRAVGGNHAQLVGNAELFERVGGFLDDLEIRPTADDDRHETCVCH